LSDNLQGELSYMLNEQPSSQHFQPVQGNVPLPDRVTEQLRTMIIEGTLEPGARLSNEPELANALGVSRSTLRSALDRLVRDGLIVRRRGVGTFVTSKQPVPTNLNVNIGATGLIRAGGATPGIAELNISRELGNDRVTQRLELGSASPIIAIERVRTANGRRVIYAREFVPVSLLQVPGREVRLGQLEESLHTDHSIHTFFRQVLGLEVHHGLAWLRPATADPFLASRLHLGENSLLMYLEQVDYDANNTPLLLSDEYWVADAFTFSVHRTT
jgi:GntR family transcriptional regulator